jgi:hypothetical protein
VLQTFTPHGLVVIPRADEGGVDDVGEQRSRRWPGAAGQGKATVLGDPLTTRRGGAGKAGEVVATSWYT